MERPSKRRQALEDYEKNPTPENLNQLLIFIDDNYIINRLLEHKDIFETVLLQLNYKDIGKWEKTGKIIREFIIERNIWKKLLLRDFPDKMGISNLDIRTKTNDVWRQWKRLYEFLVFPRNFFVPSYIRLEIDMRDSFFDSWDEEEELYPANKFKLSFRYPSKTDSICYFIDKYKTKMMRIWINEKEQELQIEIIPFDEDKIGNMFKTEIWNTNNFYTIVAKTSRKNINVYNIDCYDRLKGFNFLSSCISCQVNDATLQCPCLSEESKYCSEKCQKIDWKKNHKMNCFYTLK